MVYNNEYLEIGKIEAHYNYCIKISSIDGNVTLYLGFNTENYNFKEMPINEKMDIIKYLYWDTTLKTEETYYLFDLDKDKVYLTRLDDNKFRIEVDIENPDMIYCPLGKNEKFDNLKIDSEFSFIYKNK